MRGHRAVVASLPLLLTLGAAPALAMDLVKADSTNPYSLKANLHASGVAAWVDQDDPFDDLRNHTIGFNAELEIRGARTFRDGSQFGVHLELELDNDNNDFLATDNDDDILDKAYIFYKSVYGHVQLGSTDGAAEQMGVYAPTVSRAPRINGGNIYFFEDTDFDREFRPVVLRTDLFASGDNIKAVYFTPRKWGIQAAVSYTPDYSRNVRRFLNPDRDDFDQQSKIFELGANYVGTIGQIDLAFAGTYLTAENENPAFDFATGRDHGDLEEWGAGVNVGFGIDRFAVRVGGSYKNSNAAGAVIFGGEGTGTVDDEIDTDIWEAGIVVARGPWSVGGNYIRGDSEDQNFFIPSGLSFMDGEAYEVAVGYKVGPGIKFNLGYQHYEYEKDPDGSYLFFGEFYNGESQAELDAVYLEAALDF